MLCIMYYSRCDQYSWVHKGTYSLKCSTFEIKKKNSMIDLEEEEKGDNRFNTGALSHSLCYTVLVIIVSLKHLDIVALQSK